MKNRRCIQTKCGFFIGGGCKSCQSCKAKPYLINIKCQRCLKCEGVQDELRFGDNTRQEETNNKEQFKGFLKDKKIIVRVER